MRTSLIRLREHAGLFVALLLTSALVSGLAAGITGFLDKQATAGVRTGLTERAGAYLGLRLSLPLDVDAPEQDAQVRGMIDRRFASTIPGALQVHRTVQGKVSFSEPVADGSEIARSVVAVSLDALEGRIELVAGQWPGPGEVLMQADSAAELDLESGDQVELDEVPFVVSGTWRISDPLDPRWLGDPVYESGTSRAVLGPVIVPEEFWTAAETPPQAQWTLVPDTAVLDETALTTIPSAWRSLHRAWEGEADGLDGLVKSGRLLTSLQQLEAETTGLRAIGPLGLVLLGVVALVTFGELSRLLATMRATETALLWSRGASPAAIAGRAGIEAGVVTAVGASIGLVVAVTVTALVPGPPQHWAAGAVIVPVLATVAVATSAVAAASARSARRQTVRDPAGGAGRARRLVGPGLAALAGGAAALSVWQLQLYGSPVTPTADGGSSLDPVAAAAPALTLVAVVAIGLVVFPHVARQEERRSSGGGVRRLLASRFIARRPALAGASIIVVAAAVGALVTAAGFQATWSTSFGLAAQLRTGADLRATSDPPGISSATIDAIHQLPGVTGVAPLDMLPLQFGTGNGTIMAVSPEALATVSFSDAFDAPGIADGFRATIPVVTIPEGTRDVRLTIETRGYDVPPTIVLSLRDAFGVVRTVPLEVTGSAITPDADSPDGRLVETSYSGELPPSLQSARRSSTLFAIDVTIDPAAVSGDRVASLRLAQLAATVSGTLRDVPLAGIWLADSPIPTSNPPLSTQDGRGFTVDAATSRARLVLALDGTFDDDAHPPIVVSQQLADEFGVEVGDILTLLIPGVDDRLAAEVTAITPAVPSSPTGGAVLIDLAITQHYAARASVFIPAPTNIWVVADDPTPIAAEMRALLPANARIDSATDPVGREVLGAAAVALWVAAGGCALLAVVGVAAAGRATRRERSADVAVLRALGLSPRDQAAIRGRELLAVIGYGALTGAAVGAAIVLLTVPPFARAAIPDALPTVETVPALAGWALAASLAALGAALAVVGVTTSADVRREARTASLTEGTR
jgi:hypothetical protein